MISPQRDWIHDPTKNAFKVPNVASSGLDGEGSTQRQLIGKGAASGRAQVVRNARTGMRRMSHTTMALAILVAAPFAVIMVTSIYKADMWLPALVIALIFVIRHQRRRVVRVGKVDRRIRLPLGRHHRDS
jgi:hypothetical protein